MKTKLIFIILLLNIIMSAEPLKYLSNDQRTWEDFAIGYLFQGEAISQIANTGNIIDWDYSPSGCWKGFAYLPDISFMIGIPGKDESGNIYPWALRPSLDNLDTLVYWGPSVSESWLDRTDSNSYKNFTPLEGSNNSGITAGTLYGNELDFVSSSYSAPLLATSNEPITWPFDDYGNNFWPGWLNPSGGFFSDQDIYLSFSDKDWSANELNYEVQGYPTDIKVEMIASSYQVEELEDVLIFRAKLTNESIFNYTDVYTGFFMDADVLMGDLQGFDGSLHTNDDDMISFNEELDIVYVYDYDGQSGGEQPGYVGLMYIEDTQDRGLTGFRFFDWYSRPGVVSREGNSNCCTGDPGKYVAEDMEAIQYALLSNNIEYPNEPIANWEWRNIESGPNPRQEMYNEWYFHADPNNGQVDPNFDSIESIYYSDAFFDGPEGFDVTSFVSSGPYNINAGASIEISFAVVFGEDETDLLNNAQIIKDSTLLNTDSNYSIPSTAKLNLNYPNPFNPTTTISFTIPSYEFVSIKIYDLNNQLIKTLTEDFFSKGTHELIWNAANVSSGHYIIKMNSNHHNQSKIITLIK